MTEAKLTEIHGHGDTRRLQTRNTIKAPIDVVWDALTNMQHIKKWWTEGEMGSAPGEKFQLGSPEELRGTIVTMMKPHVFEFTWHDTPEESVHPEWLNAATKGLVHFDLIEVAAETTMLTLIQFAPPVGALGAAAGWHHIVETFTTYVETGEANPIDARFEELKQLYA